MPSLILLLFLILFGLTIIIFIHISLKKKNKEKAIAYYEKKMPALKEKEDFCANHANELLNSDDFQSASSLIPDDYLNSEAVLYFIQALRNKRADSLKEAINLYESFLYQAKMESMQSQQIAYAQENIQLQNEQLQYAKKQVDEMKLQTEYAREAAANTRSTKRAVNVNTLITLLKK